VTGPAGGGGGTQPDQYSPTTQVGSGFSAYSQKTQADYLNEMKSPFTATLAPLADLCTLIDTLPIVKSLMTFGASFDQGNTANILHGLQQFANELVDLICTLAGDVDIQYILDGANNIMNAANANPFYTTIVGIGQDVVGASGNLVVDLINGINYWLGDLIRFLGDPIGLGTGLVNGVIPALHIAGLDATKIISGQFPQNMIIGLEHDLANLAISLQEVWDAILASRGYAPGTGTSADTTNYFIDLLNMLGNPALTSAGFDAAAAVATFITDMIAPTHLLAPLEQLVAGSFTVPPINVPGLDASKIVSGMFPQNMLNITAIPANIVIGTLAQSQIPALTNTWGKTIDGSTVINAITNATLTAAALTAGAIPAGVTLGAAALTAGAIPVGVTLGAAALTAGAIGAGVTIAGSALTSAIALANVPPLPAAQITSGTFTSAFVPWAAPIDTLVQAWGGIGTGHSTADLTSAAQSIGNQYVLGTLGGTDIGTTVENHVDTLVQAINNSSVTGNSLGVLQGALAGLRGFLGYVTTGSPAPSSVAGITNNNNVYIANTAITKPLWQNVDPTLDTTVSVQTLKTFATQPTTGATQTSSVIGFLNTASASVKKSVQWVGYPTGGNLNTIADLRLNIWKVDGATGISTKVYSTPNLVNVVATGSAPASNVFNFPTGSEITTNQGDIYSIELSIVGAGTYNVVALTNNVGAQPGTTLTNLGATRNPLIGYSTATADAPVWETTGAGAGAQNSISWTHTFNGNETYCLISSTNSQAAGGGSYAVTVGGRAATLIASQSYGAGIGVAAFYLYPPVGAKTFAAGPQTVAITLSGYLIGGCSFGYSNCVGYVGTPAWITGSSTAPTQTIANTAGLRVFQLISGYTSNLTGYTQTQRFNQNYAASVNISMLCGDFLGAAGSITGAATLTPAALWGSLMVSLVSAQAPATVPAPANSGAVFTYSSKEPYFGLSGAAGTTVYSPQLIPIYASQTMTNPATTYPWANNFDVVIAGDGGGGKGLAASGNGGDGGAAGAWGHATLSRAQMGTSTLTWAIGGGGAGGVPGADGSNGAGSTVTIPGYGSVSGARGVGGSAEVADPGNPGGTLPNLTFNGNRYPGGAGGSAQGGAGGQPGGGGGGGGRVGLNGGPGGAGIGYVLCYQ
jgi:hypothetical protein